MGRTALGVIIAGLIATLGACSGADGDTGGSSSPSPATTTPDGAEVVVIETGFSELTGGGTSSWGVVVENTSHEYAAWDLLVTVRLLDAGGNQIDAIDSEVTRVLPGERIGFGNTSPHRGTDVADIAVEVDIDFWQPVYNFHWWFYPITATDVTTQATDEGATLRFAVDAAYTSDLILGELQVMGNFTAIFRDSDGAVIGGAGCCDPESTPTAVPPGRSEADLTLRYGPPPQADDGRTEVYLPDPREQLP